MENRRRKRKKRKRKIKNKNKREACSEEGRGRATSGRDAKYLGCSQTPDLAKAVVEAEMDVLLLAAAAGWKRGAMMAAESRTGPPRVQPSRGARAG